MTLFSQLTTALRAIEGTNDPRQLCFVLERIPFKPTDDEVPEAAPVFAHILRSARSCGLCAKTTPLALNAYPTDLIGMAAGEKIPEASQMIKITDWIMKEMARKAPAAVPSTG